ncbi:MAG: endo-1,4-beta-xylanase [Ignavibacteriae bacterium]|nr:MAG: endo-1,4-beta-xylanase [Ignavibacteriota bacterium]
MTMIKIVFAICLASVLIGAACSIAQTDQPILKEVFAGHFLIGAALNDDAVSGKDPRAAEIVEKQFNTITAENVMKWEKIHPVLKSYAFDAADRFVDFGLKNKMTVIGHTLIWHAQVPHWVFVDSAGTLVSRDAMLARMHDHIATVVGRYKGKVKGWDVVNEALTDDGGLVKNKWLRTIGEDYVSKAYEYAHEADPDAELYYNDFSLDKPAKRDAAVRLVKDLQSKGLRIDGVGIQGHWGMDYPIREDLDAFIDSIGALGVKVMVTEMDVDILPPAFKYMGADITMKADLKKELNPYVDGLPEEAQKRLTDRYSELFAQLLSHRGIVSRVTLWGVYDKTSWLNDWPVRGRTSYPLLFDRNYQPKAAFYALVKTAEAKR